MKSPKKPMKRKTSSSTPEKEVQSTAAVSGDESSTPMNKLEDLKEPGVSVSAGLGDTISKVTSFLGIKECDKCIQRKEILNAQFKYLQLSRDVTQEEAEFMHRLNQRPGYIGDADIKPLFTLYNSLFNKNLAPCRCGGTIAQITRVINASFKYHRDETT